MNIRNIFLLLCLSLCIVPALADEQSDSVAAKELEEVVVMGDRAWIQDGIINVIPSKQEKKLSNSPETLIESMHLPFVQVNNGSVTTLSGEGVAFFINGEPVNEIDLATFLPKDVTLLQYMENPGDPKYMGAKYVINFKMHEYEAGGVSRIDLTQFIPNLGFYDAASKLVYKKMTYGVMFKGNYSRDHRSSMSGETKYKDIYFDKKLYDEITRTEETSSYERQDGIKFAANAKYSMNNGGFILHTFSMSWDRNPGSGSHGTNLWSDNLFGSESSSSYSRSRMLTPQFSGNYLFKLSDKWYLAGAARYSHAHTNSYSETVIGDTPAIGNSIVEDVNTVMFVVQPSFKMSDKWFFNCNVKGNLDWYSTLYSGSANVRQKQARQELSGVLKASWRPVDKWFLVLEPGVIASLWKIGEIKENNVSPRLSAQISWIPSRKFYMGGRYMFLFNPVTASQSNPVMVKLSELSWTLGNPYLKGTKESHFYLSASFLPMQELSFSGYIYYTTINNYRYTRYTPAGVQYGGLLQETVNAKRAEDLGVSLTVSSSLLNKNLNINVSPSFSRQLAKEGGFKDMNEFTFRGRADYTLGNCRLMLSYENLNYSYSLSGLEKGWRQDRWDVGLTYGVKDFYFDFTVKDIFHNKAKRRKEYVSPNYLTNYNYLETGRMFIVNFTYTIGYGKKVDKSINISGPSETSSSIRNTEK